MRSPRLLAALAVGAGLAVTVLLGGCSPADPAPVVLRTAHTGAGEVVVDAAGYAVYLYWPDVPGAQRSSCAGDCAAEWPPITTTSRTPRADGVTAKLGEIPAPSGGWQVTLDGRPLYHFDGDTSAGMINGQGAGGVWWLLAPDGTRVTAVGR